MRKITFKILGLILLGLSFQGINAQEKEAFKKSFKMEGRIMYDFNFLSDGDDYHYAGNEFRRVRWATKGNIAKNIGYKVEFDFAGGAVNFRDVFLKFNLPNQLGAVKVGSFTEPSSLNNMTSSKYITFFERAMMAGTQSFKYNSGIMYDNQKLLDGRMGFQMSYTFGGDKQEAFKDTYLKEGANFVARLTGTPYLNKDAKQVVHIGMNFENRATESDTYGYKFRTENHMGDQTTVLVEDFKVAQDMGFEFATTFGPLSLQAEYEMAKIVTNAENDNEYKSNGYYAFASFFVTGEHRPYKKSSFGRVKPKKDFCLKDGGFGAFELVARYSVMDYSDFNPMVTDKTYKIANITAGFNWYLTKHSRIMYNYTNGAFNDLETYGTEGEKLTGHLVRFQVDF